MRNIPLIIILLAAAAFAGCNIKQDREDARAVAARVHAQMQSGDYATIYRESAPRFKNVGSEAEFILSMQRFHQGMGVLKGFDEIAYQTRIDADIGRSHTMLYSLEYEQGHANERMIMVRSDEGKMQLWKLDIYPTD